MNDLQRSRLRQAKESIDEARALLTAGMDTALVLNNLYLAFYYPIIALVHDGRVPDVMQSVTIGLFEQRFIATGRISRASSDAVRRAFELKPKCGTGSSPVDSGEIEHLAGQAAAFQEAAAGLLAGSRQG